MPGLVNGSDRLLKKRKHAIASETVAEVPRAAKSSKRNPSPPIDDVPTLQASIEESQRNYNNIAKLITICKSETTSKKDSAPAAVALCRIFSTFFLEDRLTSSSGLTENQKKLVQWLKARLSEFLQCLWELLRSPKAVKQQVALTLSMQLVKAELTSARGGSELAWQTGIFRDVVATLLAVPAGSSVLETFQTSYVGTYDDVRLYFFQHVAASLAEDTSHKRYIVSNALSILLSLNPPTVEEQASSTLFQETKGTSKRNRVSTSQQKKTAQKAWLAILSSDHSKDHRKAILNDMTYHVAPWFRSTELLMDYLTDSFSEGGSMSLLALSGLFHLIQEHNLDYPDFYPKLYSMLDNDILHSKQRSRFFRLMHIFLSSTHLPAALVASFIKRLSRLALHAPPAAIVAIVPWIYNMFKSHPTTTFMMHRIPQTTEERELIEKQGAYDPFDMTEINPMVTGAIDSCVWELVSLQNHYHPNVASLAKIISEQFTKERYNLDDFLDHSYASLLEGELAREIKKAPVTEWQIPKRVFREDDRDGGRLEGLMQSILMS